MSHHLDVIRSLDDYAARAASVTTHHAGTGEKDPTWAGTRTFDEALGLARDGWPEVSTQVADTVGDIMASVRDTTAQRFVPTFDVAGGSVDVGRFCAGEPEHMVRSTLRPMPTTGQVVRVLLNIGARAEISAPAMVTRGAALLALVDVLNTLGRSVELWAGSTAMQIPRGSEHSYTCLVRLKEAWAAYSIDHAMFALAHPAMHRRLTFAVRASCEDPKVSRECSLVGGGGSTELRMDVIERELGTFDLVFPEAMIRVGNPVQWVLGELAKLGIAFDE